MRDPLRIRLVFDDRHLLTKGQRSESLRRCWCLLTPDIATIADLASHISRLFDLYHSCPDGVLLSMDGFVLPSFESSSIIRDKDIVSVRKKTVKSRKVVNIEDHDALQMQDCQIVEKQTIACGDQLLAIKEPEEELEGHGSEDEENADDHPEKAISEETPLGVQINSKRKRRSSEDLGSRRKKLKQTSSADPIEAIVRVDEIHIEQDEVSLKKKARSSKNGHKKWKVASSDFAPDGMITPKVGVNDKNMSGSAISGRGKELKSTSFEELIGASERDDEIHSEKDEIFSKKRGGSSKNHKKRKVPLSDNVSDGMFTPEIGTSDKNIAVSVTSEERHNQVEGEIEINGCEALTEGARKFPSRSARRKKAKRKWKQLLANSKKQEDPGNDIQITSSKNQSSENEGKDQMEENLMPQTTELQNVEQTTDTDEEVIPIVVRPGHIRFEPVDAEQSTLQTNGKMEAFHWNGITNKKKGQKWGREKVRRDSNHDNVHTMEANEINDEVSLVNDQIDFEKLMPLTSQPKEGDVLAYRLVELSSSSWSPELSSLRVGKVSSYDSISNNVILLPVPNFPVFPDKEKEEEEEVLWQTNGSLYKEDGSLEIDYASLMDVRVFKPNKQPVHANSKHGNMTEETIIRTGDLNPVLTNNNINGTMNLTTDKTQDNEWKEIKQALDEKKEQLLKDGSSSSKNVSTGAWSYRAVRGAALGPIMALLRAKNDL